MRVIIRPVILLAMAVALPALAACASSPAPAASTAVEPFVPGLGEIMSLQQMRHTKLWLAGEARNWELAAYEVDELGGGFDDVRKAVANQDPAAFARAYDALTAACNDCHQATNFGFNRVQRPTTNPYPNQVFEPRPR